MKLFIITVPNIENININILSEQLDIIDYEDLNIYKWSVFILNNNDKLKKYPTLSIGDSEAIRNHGRTVLYYNSTSHIFNMLIDIDHPNSFWAKSTLRNAMLDSLLD